MQEEKLKKPGFNRGSHTEMRNFDPPLKIKLQKNLDSDSVPVHGPNKGYYTTEMNDGRDMADTNESHILGCYRQSKAFKTLLRRQAQAVRKIQRIKSSFTKKRQQITMLAVASVT